MRNIAIAGLICAGLALALLLVVHLGYRGITDRGDPAEMFFAGYAGIVLFVPVIALLTMLSLVLIAIAAFTGERYVTLLTYGVTALNWVIISPLTIQHWTLRLLEDEGVRNSSLGFYLAFIALLLLPILAMAFGRRPKVKRRSADKRSS